MTYWSSLSRIRSGSSVEGVNLIHTAGATDDTGSLTLTLPLSQPSTRYEIVIVAQSHDDKKAASAANAWATVNAFRERLASGHVFADSAELIREDRERTKGRGNGRPPRYDG